jgi:hypothetical protein
MEEAARNALLRRVDWRLLAGVDRVRRTAADAKPGLVQAVGAISDEVVGLDTRPQGCDLVVLSDPDEETLLRAHDVLRPGGACYVEATRPFPGAAARMSRRLGGAGFEQTSCHWPWPSPWRAPPRLWLPLEAGGAAGYFLSTRSQPAGTVHRGAALAARGAWRVAMRSGTLVPVCALGFKPCAGVRESEDTCPLPAALRARWTEWGLGPTPGRVNCWMETGGRRSVNKVVVLAFADAQELPGLAVKLARVPDSGPALAREAAALAALPDRDADGVRIPRLLFHDRLGATPAIGLTPLRGRPLSARVDPASFHRHSLTLTDFLVCLVDAAAPAPRDDWFARVAEPVLARFTDNFGTVVDPSELATARDAISAIGELPTAFEQRDLSPWNVLVGDGGELSVLDWESAEPRGLPTLDLVYFLTYAALFLEGTMDSGREVDTYARMLDARSPSGEVFHECLEQYTRAVGIEAAVLGPLRILLWMLHAQSEYQHLVGDAGGAPPGEQALLRSVFVRLWREELARAG